MKYNLFSVHILHFIIERFMGGINNNAPHAINTTRSITRVIKEKISKEMMGDKFIREYKDLVGRG